MTESSLKEFEEKKKELKEGLSKFETSVDQMKKDFQLVCQQYDDLIELEKSQEENVKKLNDFLLRKNEETIDSNLIQMI